MGRGSKLNGEIESLILNSDFFRLYIQGKQNKLAMLADAFRDTIDGKYWYFYSHNYHFSKEELDNFTSTIKDQLDNEFNADFSKMCYYHLFFTALSKFNTPISVIEAVVTESLKCNYRYLRIKALITLAWRYIWQGREEKALVILRDSHLLLERVELSDFAKFDCCFRLHYQIAQVYRHEGRFYEARLEIQKCLWLALKINNTVRVSWALMVKVGIETEWLIELPLELRKEVRKEIKTDVDTIAVLAKESNSLSIQNALKVSKYQYLKTSSRNRDKVDAERLIIEILDDPTHNWINKLDAGYHLADLRVEEYRLYESEEVFNEILEILEYIQTESGRRKSPLFLVKAKVVEAKLMEVHGDLEKAEKIYDGIKEVVSRYSLGMLSELIDHQKSLLKQNYLRMKELVDQNASVAERMNLNQLQHYIKLAQNKLKFDRSIGHKVSNIELNDFQDSSEYFFTRF